MGRHSRRHLRGRRDRNVEEYTLHVGFKSDHTFLLFKTELLFHDFSYPFTSRKIKKRYIIQVTNDHVSEKLHGAYTRTH